MFILVFYTIIISQNVDILIIYIYNNIGYHPTAEAVGFLAQMGYKLNISKR